MSLKKLFAPLDDSREAEFKKLESDALSIGNMDHQEEEQYFLFCLQALRLKNILYSDLDDRVEIADRLFCLKTNWCEDTKEKWGSVLMAFYMYEVERRQRLQALLN